MSRILKFRAWDKEENRMLYSEKTHYDVDFRCDENGCLKCYVNYSYCDSFGDEYDNWEVLDNIMQYTGLKDKNGVEIYEGDVVTACWYDYEEPNHDMTGIVEFTEGWMSYWIADYDKKEFSELNGQGYYHWTIEVIDNIHDNPERLGGAE